MSNTHRAVTPVDNIRLEDGTTRKAVFSLRQLKNDLGAHWVIEDGCYVLFLENTQGLCSKTTWIFQDAFKSLSLLPPPTKSPLKQPRTVELARLARMADDGEAYDRLCSDLFTALSSAGKEVLSQLRDSGPVWDGDLVSKSGRDELLELSLISKLVVKGEQGFQACNYFGDHVLKAGGR